MTGTASEHAERFTVLRPLLFTIAYEILGSATESDDVMQESYLRWAEVDLSTVADTKAYLAQLVTRQSLNALRAQSRRREEYVEYKANLSSSPSALRVPLFGGSAARRRRP